MCWLSGECAPSWYGLTIYYWISCCCTNQTKRWISSSMFLWKRSGHWFVQSAGMSHVPVVWRGSWISRGMFSLQGDPTSKTPHLGSHVYSLLVDPTSQYCTWTHTSTASRVTPHSRPSIVVSLVEHTSQNLHLGSSYNRQCINTKDYNRLLWTTICQ